MPEQGGTKLLSGGEMKHILETGSIKPEYGLGEMEGRRGRGGDAKSIHGFHGTSLSTGISPQ